MSEPPQNTSHEHRFIFIHVPKNAGTSIKNIFDMPGRGHVPWHYYAFCYPELWEQYTSFAVVRNPWDRVLSAYRHAKMKESFWYGPRLGMHVDYHLLADKSLEECLTILCHERGRLKNEAWHEQTVWVAAPKSLGRKIMVDRLLRFENLDDEFPQLCRELGVEPLALARINPSDRSRDYRQYYNDQSRKLVERLYASDIETFGYSF